MPKNATRYLLVFLTLLMWALSFPSLKILLDKGVEPLTLAAIRFIIPLPVIYLFYHNELRRRRKSGEILGKCWNGKGKSYFSSTESLMFYGFALFNVVLPNVLQNYGMQSTSSGVTAIIQGSGPIFTLVLAAFFLNDRLTRQQIFGVILAFCGSILLVTEGRPGFGGSTIGKMLILLSALSYAISSIFAKKLLRKHYSAEITLNSFLLGGFFLVIIAFLLEDPVQLAELDIVYWEHILFISLFPTGFAYICWYRAMKHLPLSKLAISVFLIPVMAVIFSFIFIKEIISLFALLTGGMVITGMVIARMEAIKKVKRKYA